jgi:hypothetical protein
MAAWLAEQQGIYGAGCITHVEVPEGWSEGILQCRVIHKEKAPTDTFPDGRIKSRTVVGGHRQRPDQGFSRHEKPAPVVTHLS